MGEAWRATTRSANAPSQGWLKAEYAVDPTFVQRFRAAAQIPQGSRIQASIPLYVPDYVYDYDELNVDDRPAMPVTS
jgi:hypothetical protein